MNDAIREARDHFVKLPGVKQSALADLGPCRICGKKMLEGAEVTFYRAKVERLMWDRSAIQRAVGLELQIGALASVMGPDNDLAKIYETFEAVVHERCAGKIWHLLALAPPEMKQEEGDATTG